MTTFVLRLQTPDGKFAVAAMDLPSSTTLEAATEIAINELDSDVLLERITNADTKESASLQTVSVGRPAPKGFGA